MPKLIHAAAAAASLSLIPAVTQAQATDADRAFLTKDIQGGRYEKALAELGVSKATKPAVKDYSRMVVRDHTTANTALTRLAASKGVEAPAGLTAEDSRKLDKLRGLNGEAFDQAYVDAQTSVNAQDEQDADKEKASTKDQGIKDFIGRFASMDAKHKRLAEQLKTSR